MGKDDQTLIAVLDERLKLFERMNAQGHQAILDKMNEMIGHHNKVEARLEALEKWRADHNTDTAKVFEQVNAKHASVKNILWLHAAGIVILFLINAPKFAELLLKTI